MRMFIMRVSYFWTVKGYCIVLYGYTDIPKAYDLRRTMLYILVIGHTVTASVISHYICRALFVRTVTIDSNANVNCLSIDKLV